LPCSAITPNDLRFGAQLTRIAAIDVLTATYESGTYGRDDNGPTVALRTPESFMDARWLMLGLGVAAGIGAWRFVRALFTYYGQRVIQCPENLRPAGVRVNAGYAALTALAAAPRLRLAACSRWPERAGCGQACLSQIELAPEECLVNHIVGEWYAGKSCASCGVPFGKIDWAGPKPALITADKIFVEWNQVPAERLAETLATARQICFSCHLAATLVREHPALVTDRSRPVNL
jgi:hypothetical protein